MRRFIVTMSILILAIIVGNLPPRPESAFSRVPLKDFPSKIGDWSLLREQQIDDKSMAVLQVDDYIMRTYANGRGEIISLYIGYFKTQKEGKTNHSPRQCLPGSGWAPVEAVSLMLPVSDNPGTIPVNKFLMEKGSERELFLFWYHGRGRQLSSEYKNKAYLVWDSIARNRTDGALIRINARVASDQAKTLQSQTEFIRSIYPMLSRYIPE